MKPKIPQPLMRKSLRLIRFLDVLEDNDDVQNVAANSDVDDLY